VAADGEFELMSTQNVSLKSAVVNRYLIWDIAFAIGLLAVLCAVSYLFVGEHRTAAVIGALIPLSGYILLACLERLLPPAGPRKSTSRWWMHLHINLVNMAIGIPIGAFFGSYLASAIAKHVGLNLGLIDITFDKSSGVIGIFAAGMLGVVAVDLFYYWYHRALHRSAVLWQHHKMHHLDPEFDALTGLRFNWLEQVLFGISIALPSAILFKFEHISFINAGVVNGIVLYILMMLRHINHSNLRIQFGKASFLWTSSQTHRIHHSRLPEHHDKNFVAFFPLWDVLFGTYYAPKWNEFPPTGV
jgi:sterol desaturase/sphingolipid hydroxylase (fatty acid hydroxylase superfamily)